MEHFWITGLNGKSFSSGTVYRKALIAADYKDLGWQNGWNKETELLWKQQKALEEHCEHFQWNNSGSDCTHVLHQNKVFCSVDMGD